MTLDARDIALAYFHANDALDPVAVARLYADDGEMIVNGKSVRRGADVIEAHYRRWMSELSPGDVVTELGPIIADGDHVAVEMVCTVKGVAAPMADFFLIRGGRIHKLICYVDPAALVGEMTKTGA